MVGRHIAICALVALMLVGCAGKKEAAIKRIKQGQVHYDMGVDALHKGNLPLAFRELIKAQSFQPDNANINATLALAWRYRGDLQQSDTLYRQALHTRPTPPMHNNYGNLLLQMGDLSNAEKQFRLALADPRYARQDIAFINLGDVLSAQGEFDQAITAYRKAGLINPRQSLSKLREAEAFISSHRETYAEALLLTLLRQQPANRAALEAVLPLLKQSHNPSQANTLLNKYLIVSTQLHDKDWGQQQIDEVKQWHE